MNDKIASILLFAIVCLTGIALVVAQPTVKITPWYPAETNITNTEGAARTFNVTINQSVNVSWLINATEVFNQSGVDFSEYTNTSAVAGYWNVTAYAYNENGSDIRTWWWSVNVNDTTPPNVTNYAPTGTKVSIKTDITATFNETMNSSTLNNATIIVCNSSGGTVTGIVTCDSETYTTVTFGPLSELEYNETYHVTITTGVQDRAGNNMSSDCCWNFTTRSEILKTPIVISGYVTYINDDPVKNLTVTITKTNQNTSENFKVKTVENYSYYRMQTESTHLRAGDMVRSNATDGACYKETVHNITEDDIESGGFRQNLILMPGKPDYLIIEEIKIDKNDTVFVEGCVYDITYKIKNTGDVNATESITSIEINGTEVKTDPVPELAPGVTCTKTLGHFFNCSCNQTFNVSVCADRNHIVEEINETNNCKSSVTECKCVPDLVIVTESILGTWIDRANRTFSISCTIKNIGNGNASNSTTRVYGKDDSIGPLAPGKSYNSTVGPFMLPAKRNCVEIKICADCNDNVSESNEGNNCLDKPYVFGVPYLSTTPIGEWVDYKNRTYNITYTVTNYGGGRSNESTAYVYIDGSDNASATDTVPELAKVPSCEKCKGEESKYSNTLGPFNMTGTSDTFQVRLECDGSFTVGEFSSAACVADDGTVFRCGDHITKSCTFTGDMYCGLGVYTGRRYPHGLFIDSDDITIDGNGSAIIGDRDACACMYGGAEGDIYITWTGITNAPGGISPGYDNVTIKNLEVMNFCNGISIVNANNNLIENCKVHDNGATVQYNYGIYVENSNHITIDRCEVYSSTGILTDMNVAGGHGINFQDDCDYCAVTNGSISHNYLSGILASPTCKYLYIGNNTIEENGQCSESGFCAGVNLHWKGGFGLITNSTVENNTIVNNTGSGIYVTQGYTTIKDNLVRGSKNGTDVTGNGILIEGGSVTFVYNNTCCDNEGTDIVNSVNSFATFGDDNTCDTTENYDDDDSIGCSFYCGGVNGVCKGATKIFGCGDVVTESCTFNHSMSCRGCDAEHEYGLIVGAENATIDGAGYKLSGNFTGIGIFSNYTGVTVKNLQVEDFSTGMKIENASANIIENCIVCRNRGGQTGINFSADNGTVRNNRIYDNNGTGIFVSGANNVFENNTVSRNKNGTLLPGYGIYFSADAESNNNNISANFIGDNDATDIYIDDGQYTGDNNTCDTTHNYQDVSMKGKEYGCTHAWTPPDLVITDKFEKWIDNESARYNVTYTIENIKTSKSRPAGSSTTYLHIWYMHAANDSVGSLKPGENYTNRTFGYTPKMLGDSDKIKVCADGADEIAENNEANKFYCNDVGCYWLAEFFKLKDNEANNCLENEFYKSDGEEGREPESGVACVCKDGWCNNVGREYYKCGDTVTESCTFKECTAFTGSMSCTDVTVTTPCLRIGKDNIVIEGNGHAMKGAIGETAVTCGGRQETPAIHSGIYNKDGYDNVVIKNLEIWNFCTGIALLKGERGDLVENNVVDNCKIHHNGQYEGVTHGIHMVAVKDTKITNNDIYNNRGTGDDCGGGGNGIFLLAYHIPNANNEIVDNDLHDNDRAGFWTKVGMNRCTIKDNRIWGNSRGSGLGGMTGGLVLQCVKSDHNTIEKNVVWDNYGRGGIFIGGNYNTIRNNNVTDNKGDGIYMGRSDSGSTNNHLKNNTVCHNAGMDIKTVGEDYDNDGDGNFCDTTKDYKDGNAAKGCKCSQPCSNVSKPDLTVTEKFETWVIEGESYNVTYTVTNIGKVDAGASTTRIQILGGESKLDPVRALTPNESVTRTVGSFTMSHERENETITVCADYDGKVEKLGLGTRDNNCRENTWTALPDLTVTKIEVPDELSLFKSNTVTAKIENIGTVKTGDAFTVALFVDHSTVPEDTAAVSGLDADGITFKDLTWKPLIRKDYTLKVVVDWVLGVPEGAIHESREDNNEMIKEITEKTVDYDLPKGPGGPGTPPGEENVTGYEPGPGGGTGEFGADIGGEELPVNESETVSGGETRRSGHPFGMGSEIIENVKVVAPVFLIIMVVMVIALFYSGYFGEKRAHRRNNRREK